MAPKHDEITASGNAAVDNHSPEKGEVFEMDATQGQLKRGFKNRHVNMFAIAGSIGTGLII